MPGIAKDKIVNPATGRLVSKDGKIGKGILEAASKKKSAPGKIINPATGRLVSKDGAIGKRILEAANKAKKSPSKRKPKTKASSKEDESSDGFLSLKQFTRDIQSIISSESKLESGVKMEFYLKGKGPKVLYDMVKPRLTKAVDDTYTVELAINSKHSTSKFSFDVLTLTYTVSSRSQNYEIKCALSPSSDKVKITNGSLKTKQMVFNEFIKDILYPAYKDIVSNVYSCTKLDNDDFDIDPDVSYATFTSFVTWNKDSKVQEAALLRYKSQLEYFVRTVPHLSEHDFPVPERDIDYRRAPAIHHEYVEEYHFNLNT